jgi:hypothetical protein
MIALGHSQVILALEVHEETAAKALTTGEAAERCRR